MNCLGLAASDSNSNPSPVRRRSRITIEADGCGFKNWVLLNQECCTPKTTIRIRVSVLFSFVGVKSNFLLKFYGVLHFMNFKVVVM
jgi:hypothetical protein